MDMSRDDVLVLSQRELERLKVEARGPIEKRVQRTAQYTLFQRAQAEQFAKRVEVTATKHELQKSHAAELHREEVVAARVARDEAAAREWRLHFWARDGVKQLHSALKLTEVLREREAQGSLNEATQERAAKYRAEAHQREHEAARQAREQEKERRRAEAERKAKLRNALQTQMSEHEARRREEAEEVRREREEMQQLVQQLCDETRHNKTQATEKQKNFIREFLRTAEAARAERHADEERDKLEQRLCDLTLREKHETRDRFEAERRKALEKRMARRQKQAEELYRACQERLAIEHQRAKQRDLELAQRERDLVTAKQEREREKRRVALEVREQQRARAEEQRQEHARRVDAAEREARKRHDEVTRAFAEQQRRELRELHERNARAYAEQAERQRVEMELERAAEHAAAARERMAWEMEDRQFLDYAGQVLKEANVVGRPEKPLQRALQNYKKKFNIGRATFVKASMISQLDIGLDQTHDH